MREGDLIDAKCCENQWLFKGTEEKPDTVSDGTSGDCGGADIQLHSAERTGAGLQEFSVF